MKDKIRDWLNVHIPLAKALNDAYFDIHIEEWVNQKNETQQQFFDTTLSFFNDMVAVVKDFDLGPLKLRIEMELQDKEEGFTYKPDTYKELINAVEHRFFSPEIQLYKPQNSYTNIVDISESFTTLESFQFYSDELHFDEIKTDGILHYHEHKYGEDDYTRFIHFLLKEQTYKSK